VGELDAANIAHRWVNFIQFNKADPACKLVEFVHFECSTRESRFRSTAGATQIGAMATHVEDELKAKEREFIAFY